MAIHSIPFRCGAVISQTELNFLINFHQIITPFYSIRSSFVQMHFDSRIIPESSLSLLPEHWFLIRNIVALFYARFPIRPWPIEWAVKYPLWTVANCETKRRTEMNSEEATHRNGTNKNNLLKWLVIHAHRTPSTTVHIKSNKRTNECRGREREREFMTWTFHGERRRSILFAFYRTRKVCEFMIYRLSQFNDECTRRTWHDGNMYNDKPNSRQFCSELVVCSA